MSHDVSDGDRPLGDSGEGVAPEDYGGLTVEDEPVTVDPADLAGTTSDGDEEVGYEPTYSEADGNGEDAD